MDTQRQQEATMFAKKLVLLTASGVMLSAASAAFADRSDWSRSDGWRARQQNRVVVQHYPRAYHYPRYVARPAYYPPRAYNYEPAYTYYAPAPTYYAPAPVYYGGGATLGGAVVGAIIGNQISDRHHRSAATAAGALVGAFVGSRLEYGY
jgi:hypothetical protein